jgi:hypothetical protein
MQRSTALVVVALAHWCCAYAVAALPSNQVRLGLGATPESSMVVTWFTARSDMYAAGSGGDDDDNASTPPGSGDREYLVYYATSPDGLAEPGVRTVAGSSQEYNITDSVYVYSTSSFAPTVVYFSPYIHHAELNGLAPLTRYFYQVTVEGGKRSAEVFNFTTVSRRGELPNGSGPSLTVICGDVGQTENSRNTISAIMEHRGYTDLADAVQFAIIVGDMSYVRCCCCFSRSRAHARDRARPPRHASAWVWVGRRLLLLLLLLLLLPPCLPPLLQPLQPLHPSSLPH